MENKTNKKVYPEFQDLEEIECDLQVASTLLSGLGQLNRVVHDISITNALNHMSIEIYKLAGRVKCFSDLAYGIEQSDATESEAE